MKKFLKAFFSGLGFVAIFLGAQAVVSTIFSFILSFKLGFDIAKTGAELNTEAFMLEFTEKLMSYTTLISVISAILSLLIVFIIFKARRKNLKHELSLNPIGLKTVPILLIMGVSFNFFIGGIMSLLPIPESLLESYAQQSSSLAGADIITFLATVIMAPLAEEVFCRGLMLSRFKKGMPTAVAIVLQGVVFGLMHGHPLWIAYAAILGIVIGVVANKQNSILGTIIFHLGFNLTGFIISALKFETANTVSDIMIVVAAGLFFVALFVLLFKQKVVCEEVAQTAEITE